MKLALDSRFYFLNSHGAQAALSLVLLIGGVVIIIGVTLAFLVSGFAQSSLGLQAALRALAVANAGVEDGVLQLVRNKSFSDVLGYTVPVGSEAATVTVTQNLPSPGFVTVLSTATVARHRRRIRAVLSVDAVTGEVRVVQWQLASQ